MVKIPVAPEQIGVIFETLAVGPGVTVTVAVEVVEQPQEFVAVSV